LLNPILKRKRNRNRRGKKRLTERNKRNKKSKSARKQLQNIRFRMPSNNSVRNYSRQVKTSLTIQLMIQLVLSSASGH
jgi:hypothetical protein